VADRYMDAQFTCRRCQSVLSLPVMDLNKRVQCPLCSSTFIVVVEGEPGASPFSTRAAEEPFPRTPARSLPARSPMPVRRPTAAAEFELQVIQETRKAAALILIGLLMVGLGGGYL